MPLSAETFAVTTGALPASRKVLIKKALGVLSASCRCIVGLLVFVSLQTIVSANAQDILQSAKVEVVEIKDAVGIIAPPQISSDVIQKQCSRPTPASEKVSGYWMPNKQQLEELETIFPKYLKKSPNINSLTPKHFYSQFDNQFRIYFHYYRC
jgi:hypothetical protein